MEGNLTKTLVPILFPAASPSNSHTLHPIRIHFQKPKTLFISFPIHPMEKSKVSEESSLREKSDGLEIISIGSLFKGPWDKKYWSSSRGKDRYPYPIGYQAIRSHNGTTYTMEIYEGVKGPKFVITSDHGVSCSGQTPDIAWGGFQKKISPQLKIWHGKRFSCKIDGVEFFGFKYPSVQRLLRELVADLDGTAEQSMTPSSLSSGVSRAQHGNGGTDVDAYPCFLLCLGRSYNAKKRSRNCEKRIIDSKSSILNKRFRCQELMYGSGALNTKNLQQDEGNSLPLSHSELADRCGDLPASLHLASMDKDNSCNVPSRRSLRLNSTQSSDCYCEKANPSDKTRVFLDSKCNDMVDSSSDEEHVKNYDVKAVNYLMETGSGKEAASSSNVFEACNVDICAPDSLDLTQAQTSDSAPSFLESKRSSNVKEDLASVEENSCEGLTRPKYPEELVTYKSDKSSGSSDSDPVLHEIPKSMMTLLLPQAIPLLKVSRKKMFTSSTSEDLPCMVPCDENNADGSLQNVQSSSSVVTNSTQVEREEKINFQITDNCLNSPSSEPVKTVIPDSFEDRAHVVASALWYETSFDHLGIEGSKAQFHDADSKDWPQGSDICVSDSFQGQTSTRNELILEGNKGANRTPEGNQTNVGLNSMGEDTKTVHDLAREKFEMVGMNNAETVTIPLTTTHNMVHTRKKVKNAASTTGKYIGPLSESIIYRKLEENSVPGKSPVKGTLLPFDIVEVSSSDRMAPKLDSSRAETMPGIQSCDLCRKPVENSIPEIPPVEGTLLATGVAEMGSSDGNHCKPDSLRAETLLQVQYHDLCRGSGENSIPDKHPANVTFLATDIVLRNSADGLSSKLDSSLPITMLGEQPHDLHRENTTISSPNSCIESQSAPTVSENEEPVCASKQHDFSPDLSNFDPDLSVSYLEPSCTHTEKELVNNTSLQINSSFSHQKPKINVLSGNLSSEDKAQARLEVQQNHNQDFNHDTEGIFELVGCYYHPMPVSSLFLITRENEIRICVLCGLLVNMERTLFIYKVEIEKPSTGCPSFMAHTPIMLPKLENNFGGEISAERSGFQISPDGKYLVLLGNIKTPNCRGRKLCCFCSTCKSICSEDKAVKIVRVEHGFVSVVAILQSIETVQCILVCEPNKLVSVGDSGRLQVWVMNTAWSAQTEEFIIPANDSIFPCILELKRIPRCAHLIIGYNGFGEFSLWDISSRICISTFSSNNSIFQFFPISLLHWQTEGLDINYSGEEELIDKIMVATNQCFRKHSDVNSFHSCDSGDIAVWGFVATASDVESEHNHAPSESLANPARIWRLALLVQNKVFAGSQLDERASAVGASAGHGIIGTSDGLIYFWEMCMGVKLGNLYCFKGSSVTGIATDDSRTGTLAVADDHGQLLVYLQPNRTDTN